jgi:glycine/D-amino acid oxidase-like deaminating enzyme
MRKEVDSPTYLGGLARPDGGGLVDPGALVRGLARVALERGVTIHEGSPVVELRAAGSGVLRGDPRRPGAGRTGRPRHQRLQPPAAAAARPLVRAGLRPRAADRPADAEQLGRIGWEGRQGLADTANQFHYYRLTPDDRILWGGYDAIYRYGSQVGPRYDHRRATYDLLARNFRRTFPQLDDVPFERWWGGPIATTTRFTVTFGDTLGGRAVWALGYTGLGVATSRFAARVLTDKLLDPGSPLLDLRFTSTRPVPFPPEPLRWAGVALTRRAIQRADAREGRRGPWLALLDRFGIGFDS